jgi:hypothetical protein
MIALSLPPDYRPALLHEPCLMCQTLTVAFMVPNVPQRLTRNGKQRIYFYSLCRDCSADMQDTQTREAATQAVERYLADETRCRPPWEKRKRPDSDEGAHDA